MLRGRRRTYGRAMPDHRPSAIPIRPPRAAALVALLLAALAGCATTDRTATAPRPAAPPPDLKAQGYVVVPRTNIALRPPAGFAVDARLPGLARRSGRSSLLVLQERAPRETPERIVDELASGAADTTALARRGITLTSAQRFSVDGHPAVGWTGTQRARGAELKKAFVAFPSHGHVVMLTATLAADDPVSATQALAILRAARWSAYAEPGDPGYAVTPAEGYVQRPSSAGLTYTRGGESGPGVAVFAGEASHAGPVLRADRLGVARARFSALPGSPRPASERRVTIAGLPGWEFTGTGRENGRDQATYAAVLFTGDGHLALAGTFDPRRYRDQTGAFRAMARSLTLTDRRYVRGP
jgi:hypothetical protein